MINEIKELNNLDPWGKQGTTNMKIHHLSNVSHSGKTISG